jgi:hypothetical protein
MKDPADDMCHVSQSVADWRFADRVRNGPGAVSLKYNATRVGNSTLSRQIYRASAQISVSDMCIQFTRACVQAFPRDKAGIEMTEISLFFYIFYMCARWPRVRKREIAPCGSKRFDVSASNGYSFVSHSFSNANEIH